MTTQNSTIKILVVDDDIDFLTQMEIQLKAVEYQVLTAGSQAEAEELMRTESPDLAIIDLMMEHTDGGFALCYHIKKKNQATPVIIVTGVASETGLEFDSSTQEEKSWIKADVMLAKPVRFEQLHHEIMRLLQN